MPTYARRPVDDVITVRSLVTVYRFRLFSTPPKAGEVHDFPEIFYVEEGERHVALDGIPYMLQAGQMLVYAPDTFHASAPLAVDPPARVGIISFETLCPLPERVLNRVITLTAEQRESYAALLADGVHLFGNDSGGHLDTLPREPQTERQLQKLKNRLELFLLELCGDEVTPRMGNAREYRHQRRMQGVTAYLTAHLDKTFTLQQMAQGCGLSVSTLRRLVAAEMGCGPIAYFHQLKIEEAQRLLRQTPMSVTAVAERLGFSSIHYFSRQFKQATGVCPSAYAQDETK